MRHSTIVKRVAILAVVLMACCPLVNIASAQTYRFQSLQGTKVHVTLSDSPSSKPLAISYLGDTLFIADYWALDTVKTLNSRFLQITYATRAGSNEGSANMILLCIDNRKLRQAMNIRSFREYDMRNMSHIKGSTNEYQLFKVKAQLIGNEKNTYKLKLGIHDESRSERKPKNNYVYNKQTTLKFDANHNIFYSTHEKLSRTFMMYDSKSRKTTKLNVNEVVPVITLEKRYYYYIEGNWYEKDSNENLLKQSYR